MYWISILNLNLYTSIISFSSTSTNIEVQSRLTTVKFQIQQVTKQNFVEKLNLSNLMTISDNIVGTGQVYDGRQLVQIWHHAVITARNEAEHCKKHLLLVNHVRLRSTVDIQSIKPHLVAPPCMCIENLSQLQLFVYPAPALGPETHKLKLEGPLHGHYQSYKLKTY